MRKGIIKGLVVTILVATFMSLVGGCTANDTTSRHETELTEGIGSSTEKVTEELNSTEGVSTEETTESTEEVTEDTEVVVEDTEEVTENADNVTEEIEEQVGDVVTFTECNNIKYSTDSLNVRTEPNAGSTKVGTLNYGTEVKEVGIGSNGWSKIEYNGEIRYVNSSYLSDEKPTFTSEVPVSSYPITYSDETCTITIYREWFEDAWCYAAHIVFTDYERLGTTCGNGKYGGYETTSHMAQRLGAILAINGCYSPPYLDYTVVRSGVVYNGGERILDVPGVYSSKTGLLTVGHADKYTSEYNATVNSLVSSGLITDTFHYGGVFLIDGKSVIEEYYGPNNGSRAQRTFIGTNGEPGDIWLIVSNGRYVDGVSAGLTPYQMTRYLQTKGCTFGVPLDGGGSSTMYFKGMILNTVKEERAVVDFVYFR